MGFVMYDKELKGNIKKCIFLETIDHQRAIGPEDFQQFSSDILITVSDLKAELWEGNYPEFQPNNIKSGGLFAIHMNSFKLSIINITNFDTKNIDFRPHGIYLMNKTELYVINHAYQRGGERLDHFHLIFNQESQTLTAQWVDYTSFDQKKYNGILNSIIFINPKQFIITQYLIEADPLNGRRSEGDFNHLMFVLQTSLNLRKTFAHVCEYKQNKQADCVKLQNTASIMANGITWDRKDKIFISDMLNKEIKYYNLNQNTKDIHDLLIYNQSIQTTGHSDNLFFDENKNIIYCGQISKLFHHMNYVEHFKNSGGQRSQIVEFMASVDIIDIQTLKLTNILNRNDTIMGASAAYLYNDKYLFLGSWVDLSVKMCEFQ